MLRSMIAVTALAISISAASAGELTLQQTFPDQYGNHPTYTINCSGIKAYAETIPSSTFKNYNVAIEGMPLTAFIGDHIPEMIENCWAHANIRH